MKVLSTAVKLGEGCSKTSYHLLKPYYVPGTILSSVTCRHSFNPHKNIVMRSVVTQVLLKTKVRHISVKQPEQGRTVSGVAGAGEQVISWGSRGD